MLYGPEVLETAYALTRALGVEESADDNPCKQGTRRDDLVVQRPEGIAWMEPDLVPITTLRHVSEIRERMPEVVRGSVPILEL